MLLVLAPGFNIRYRVDKERAMTDGSDPSTNAGSGPENRRIEYIRERANWMRRRLLRMIVDAGQGHPGGDLSATDIPRALLFDFLRIVPSTPRFPLRAPSLLTKRQRHRAPHH